MAALYGMDIDNCIVECDAPEMPGMDGSALAISVALDRAGIRRQSAPSNDIMLTSPLRVGTDHAMMANANVFIEFSSGIDHRSMGDYGWH